ncbi:MAG: PD40 domain-containing protein [Bacteroidetes bacterium]|nr:PD40 domain-containing protein [Bacteroidota bacterium]
MKSILIVLVSLALSPASFGAKDDTSSVSKTKIASPNVSKADILFTNQQYREALNAYYPAYQNNSSNADLNFKMGLCYHYLLQYPALCKSFFTRAATKLSSKYDFYNNKNAQSSLDAKYFLGKTYLELNNADSAMLYLADWSSELKNQVPMDGSRQIKMCINFNTLKSHPHHVTPERLPLPVNTLFSETNPVLSIDHSTLFFASRKPETEKEGEVMANSNIYSCTIRPDGTWNDPVSFTHNTAFDEEPLYLTTDGKKLYFRRTDKTGKGDIYFSTQDGGIWAAPQKYKEANSSSDENGIAFSTDGNWMAVSSNRPEGMGGHDLYIAKGKDGKFGKLKNMGKKVNTALDELSPYFHPVDKRIYYSSNGNTQYGMGGFDVFFTQFDSTDNWSEAFTMGYPVNKGGNEMNYYVVSDAVSYYTAIGDNGDFDIYELKRGNGPAEDIEDKIIAEHRIAAPADNSIVEILEVEKEKIVEKEKEVEVSKVEEVKVEVQKNVGMVEASQAKDLDNVIAIEQHEVQVQVPVEVEVVKASGTRPVMQTDGTVINQDGTIHQELTDQNKGVSAPTPSLDINAITPSADNPNDASSSSSYNNTDNSSSYNSTDGNTGQDNSASNISSYNKSPASATPVVTKSQTGKSEEKISDIELPDISHDTIDPVKAKENYELAMKQLDQAGVSDEGKVGIIANVTRMLEEKLRHERTAVFKSIYFDFNSKSLGLSKVNWMF